MRLLKTGEGRAGCVITFLFTQSVLLLSVKKMNPELSFYDAVMCSSMYAYMTIYTILPFFFSLWLNRYYRPENVVRFESVKKLWLINCGHILLLSVFCTVWLLIDVCVCGFFVSDHIVNWDTQGSLYFKYTLRVISDPPSIFLLLSLVAGCIFVNCLMIGMIMASSRFVWNKSVIGYIAVVLIYVIPNFLGADDGFYKMMPRYEDFIHGVSPGMNIIRRCMIEFFIIVGLLYLGFVKGKRDYID